MSLEIGIISGLFLQCHLVKSFFSKLSDVGGDASALSLISFFKEDF